MRKVLLTFAIVFTIAMTSAAFAQTPYFQLYFDEGLQEASADCPGPGVLDTLYIAAHNFDMWISAAEFQVDYPVQLTWLGEVAIGSDLVIGQSFAGVAISYPLPRPCFPSTILMRVTVMWSCDDCVGIPAPGAEVVINEWPGEASPQAVNWQTEVAVDGVGMTSLVCAQVPVEETSWGKIKSLYH